MIPIFDGAADGWRCGKPRVLIFGPPGTGKTRTMLDAFIVPALEDGVLPERILACSFSRAAAGELRSRLAALTGMGESGLRQTCSTTHAEAYRRVCERRGEVKLYDGVNRKLMGGKRGSVPAGEAPSAADVDRLAGLGGDSDDLRTEALRVWDFARQRMMEHDRDWLGRLIRDMSRQVLNKLGIGVETVMREIERYEDEKREHEALDFTDMLREALNIPARPFDLLIQDEQQDATPLQHALFAHWTRQARRVAVVGDADQAIHEWAGVQYKDFVAMSAAGSGYEVRRLAQSYRVPAAVHDAAMRIIRRNMSRVDVDYHPTEADGLVAHGDYTGVAGVIAGSESRTMLCLARSARAAGRMCDALAAAGVPFKAEAGGSPFASVKINLAFCALAYLRQGKPAPRHALSELVACLPVKGSGIFTKPRTQVVEAVAAGPEMQGVPDGVTLAAIDAAKHVCKPTGPRDKRCDALTQAVRRYGPQVLMFPATVTVTTMHKSKGREADVVAVLDAAPAPVLEAMRNGDAGAMEAERRVLYVALTRAKDSLIVAHGRNGESFGEIPDGHNATDTEIQGRYEAAENEAVPF